ncbi:MAG: nitrile hydratase accessory protein [Gammaproteobacteria bacterium]|nr:nitrile hydratase accessory protein [Gammaproteobacteria bacterium]
MNREASTWIDSDAAEAPPSANGELLFEAPWEARAFGMAVSLADAGCFSWDEFRAKLIEAIAAWERQATPGAPYRYYECWLTALSMVIDGKGLGSATDLAARAEALAARPHGHDHG